RLGKTLVHFICHGEDAETAIAAIRSGQPAKQTKTMVQIIKLERGQKLNSSQLRGLPNVEAMFTQHRPFVFLNACEVGRAMPALVGVGGFAKSFIDLGASAVIAPLWGVKDAIAQNIAATFYQRVLAEPQTPFAEILRDLRRKAYEPGK